MDLSFMTKLPSMKQEWNRGFRAFSCLQISVGFQERFISDEDAIKKENEWLRTQGYISYSSYYTGDLNDVLWTMACINPDIYYIITGNVEEGPHCAVAINDMIIHDPADRLIESMAMKPIEGRYWIKVVIPLILKR